MLGKNVELGKPLVTPPLEISLFTNELAAAAGVLPPGPDLPAEPVELGGFLVDCGAVTNGWAYTVKNVLDPAQRGSHQRGV